MSTVSLHNKRRQLLREFHAMRDQLAGLQGDFEGTVSHAATAWQEAVEPEDGGKTTRPGWEGIVQKCQAAHADARKDVDAVIGLVTELDAYIARLEELRDPREAAEAEREIADRREIGKVAIARLRQCYDGMSVDVILTYPDTAKELAARVRAEFLRPDLTDHDILSAMVAERKRGGGRIWKR